jgi:anthranilate phosphoribosyltransferase
MMQIQEALARLLERQDLSAEEMEQVMRQIMRGEATPAQIGALLVALRLKGETVEEIIGAVRAMRAEAVQIHPIATVVVDTCGTGGDRRGTFNISTATAFAVAGAGITVAKHGNRAMSGTVGGADVLEALGVKIDLDPERVAACVDTIGIGFLFAQTFHPAMRHAAGPRRELGIRTIFNLLGPLSNPAGARHQVVGVFAPEWIEPLAHALGHLGSTHALVVHSKDGLDEISLAAETTVAEWREGAVRSYQLAPEDFGLVRCRVEDLRGGATAMEGARIVREILNGEPGPRFDTVLLNAAAALYAADAAASIAEGLPLAHAAIRSGNARQKLDELIRFSHA